MSGPAPVGVMDAGYARDRARKPHLAFRLRCRALIAARMYRRFATSTHSPRVLDLGSADGLAMVALHRELHAAESVGIEYAADLIAAANLPGRCSLHRGDVCEPHAAAADGSFDLVTALAVLEHVDNAPALARRVFAALRPGGLFIATCPSPVWDRVSGTLGLHKDEHHTGAFTRARFEAFAASGGLTPVRYQRFMFALVGFLPYARVPVSAAAALRLDAWLAPMPIVNLAMVNQVFVARR